MYHCREFNNTVLEAIATKRIRRVALVAYWSAYLEIGSQVGQKAYPWHKFDANTLGGGTPAENVAKFEAALKRTVSTLQGMGVETWIIRQVPRQRGFVPRVLSNAVRSRRDPYEVGITLDEHREDQYLVNSIFASVDGSVRFIDPAEQLCAHNVCICAAHGRSLYRDDNHLSTAGALFLTNSLARALGTE